MEKICFLNGSPSGNKATSKEYLNDLGGMFKESDYDKFFMDIKVKPNEVYSDEEMNNIADADVIIIAFPLYADCLPAAFIRFLEDYYFYLENNQTYNKNARVYVIVNCAAYAPEANSAAIRVIKNFCSRLELNWRFAVSIGSGLLIKMTKKIPFLNKAHRNIQKVFITILEDVNNKDNNEKDDILIKPNTPEPSYSNYSNVNDNKLLKKFMCYLLKKARRE